MKSYGLTISYLITIINIFFKILSFKFLFKRGPMPLARNRIVSRQLLSELASAKRAHSYFIYI